MGVTIEQYRARIGTFNNAARTKDLSRFECVFWNRKGTLIVLARSLYLLGCVVYVALLLRMANDVEENPGPTLYDIVDPSKTICADFSQSNARKFGRNAGKQCVAMSLTAIVETQVKNMTTWDTSFLNKILCIGNNLYTCIHNSINKDYLLLSDVPEMVSVDNKVYCLQYSASFSGDVFKIFDDEPFYTLKTALNKIFSPTELNYQQCLLTIDCSTVAICMISEGTFKIFDSHSKDLYGIPDPFGKSVLIHVESLDNLSSFFQNTYPPNITIPFEVKGIKSSLLNTVTECDNHDIRHNKILDHREIQLGKRRQRYKERKENETTEIRNDRLAKRREMRKKQSSDKRKKELFNKRQRVKQNIIDESSEARKIRLLKKSQQTRQTVENETTEQRKMRLLNKRTRKKQAIHNESDKQRESRLTKKRQKAKQAYHNRFAQSEENCTLTLEELIANFHNAMSNGPIYICTCCDQLWYKHSVFLADKIRASHPDAVKLLQNIISVNNAEWLCHTCMKHLKSGKVPPLAVVNGMKFPEKPATFFYLNELECRLIAPRLAFQKIMQAPRGKQLKINGNVVNVPADVINTVNLLPRLPEQSGTIKVQLKRRLQYKSSALSLNIRPHKVLQAANWLASSSTLYQDQGITFNPDWENNFGQSDELNEQIDETSENVDSQNKIILPDDDDEFSEDEAEIPAGVTDSMLTPPDFVDDSEREHILNVAPGEGNRPLSAFKDKFSEELAYPGIFLGQQRPENKDRLLNVYYSDICKSELRRSDRRAAMCVENIFFKTKKLQMKLLLGKSQIALRKCKGNNSSLTAGQLKQRGNLERLIHHDEGYKFFRALRGSPPYFEKAKKDLFAMIRQLGPATLFCSFSSAETKWMHLLKILGKLVDQRNYTDEELENLNWEDKCRLIQSDPVTCARDFDYQLATFLKQFLLSKIAPIGKIRDWFYRVEYQQRGSPHVHMLIWLEDAPAFGVDEDEVVSSFIDKIITCRKPDDDTTLLNLVNRQMHRHSHTCRKK